MMDSDIQKPNSQSKRGSLLVRAITARKFSILKLLPARNDDDMQESENENESGIRIREDSKDSKDSKESKPSGHERKAQIWYKRYRKASVLIILLYLTALGFLQSTNPSDSPLQSPHRKHVFKNRKRKRQSTQYLPLLRIFCGKYSSGQR
jgi:hypothetical protein